jgi:protein TonB
LLRIRDAAAQSDRQGLDRWLAEARALGVSPTRLADAMRAAPPTPAVQPAVPQSERLAQLVQNRINDGRLLEPSQDSAVAYLNALRAEDPSGSAVAAGTRALSNALLNRGRQSLVNRKLDAAQADAAAAGRLGLNSAEVDALERAIGAARATPATRQSPPVEIKRTRYVPPEYPADALRKGIRGEVRVQITVGGDGKVKSATVVNSSPAAVFDRAALDAVRRWRFAPPAVDNPDTEATVMTNIVFRPDEAKGP